jgi:predicted methyltransferase
MRINTARLFKKQEDLPRIWSKETQLTQTSLIYCGQLLEEMLRELKYQGTILYQLACDSKKRYKNKKPLSEWQKHVAETLKNNGTMREASTAWKIKREHGTA